MRKIINGAKLTFEREKEFLHFQAITEGEMRKEGDTIMNELNRKIEFLKGKSILSYYTPTDTNKEKEPILDRELQRKWLPAKSEAHQVQNEKQSATRAQPERRIS